MFVDPCAFLLLQKYHLFHDIVILAFKRPDSVIIRAKVTQHIRLYGELAARFPGINLPDSSIIFWFLLDTAASLCAVNIYFLLR